MKSSLAGGSSTDVSKLLQNAKQNHKAGRLRAAEGLYRKALELGANNAEAIHFLGLLQHQQGKGAAAVDLMRRSLALKPESGEYHSNLDKIKGDIPNSIYIMPRFLPPPGEISSIEIEK